MAGIYLHIPFCKKKCHYCDFYKSLDTGKCGEFINSLLYEISARENYIADNELIETIYFGGGTPSVLNLAQVEEILCHLHKNFNISSNAEISFEINPDDISNLYLSGLASNGINRLSIGIQAWQDNILKFLNRRHNSLQAENAIMMAREEGFKNISVDLIYGIPGLKSRDWENNLVKSFNMGVEHLSAYHLTIEENTFFGRLKKNGDIAEVNEDISEEQFSILTRLAGDYNYIHYEISNLCREGFYSKHNSSYWKQKTYLGLGPSAHSFNGYSRQWNCSDLKAYIHKCRPGGDIGRIIEKEILDEKTRFNEYILTSLRTIWGADLNYVENTFSKEMHDYLLNISSRFIKYGLLEKKDHAMLVLTNQGKMISVNIIREIIM